MLNLLLARLRNRWIRSRLQGKALNSPARKNLTALDGLNLRQAAKTQRYVVFDLETTGLSPKRDRVVSVAALPVIEGRIPLGDIFSSLVNPGRDIPSSAVKIHGIVPSMVNRAPVFADVLDQFLRYVGADVLVGYHVRFDLRFLNRCMRQQYGFPLQNLVLDVRLLCRKIVLPPHLRSYAVRYKGDQGLDAVAKHFGIDIYERHAAVGDALATAMIFQRVLAALEEKGPGRLRDLIDAAGGM